MLQEAGCEQALDLLYTRPALHQTSSMILLGSGIWDLPWAQVLAPAPAPRLLDVVHSDAEPSEGQVMMKKGSEGSWKSSQDPTVGYKD